MKRAVFTGLALVLALMSFAAVAQSKPTVEAVKDPKHGEYLVAANGNTLYMFTHDQKNTPTCTGECATLWLPYTAEQPLTLGPGLSGELTLIQHEANSEGQGSAPGTGQGGGRGPGPTAAPGTGKANQVAYNGIPLYFYAKDLKPGDVNGQGAGGAWFIVRPGQQFGQNLGATPSASPQASPAASPAS